MPKQTAHPTIDRHIGARLRALRSRKAYTQRQLADLLSVKHQQIQKYEAGTSRLAVSQLVEIARHFNVSLQYFISGLAPELAPPPPPVKVIRLGESGLNEASAVFDHGADEGEERVGSLLSLLAIIRQIASDALDPVAEELP
jgi:transcriptional regulator with XRE-family HTH domain